MCRPSFAEGNKNQTAHFSSNPYIGLHILYLHADISDSSKDLLKHIIYLYSDDCLKDNTYECR